MPHRKPFIPEYIIPFKYTLLLFSRFIFLDTNIKGTIFSGRVRSHPSHLPQLRAWELRDYLIQFCWDAVCITCFCLLFILDIQKQPPGVFWKKGVLRNFKINRKTPVPESLFNTVAGLTPATLLKKRLWLMCFPVNFVKFLRTRFLQNTSGRLLLVFKTPSEITLQNQKTVLSKKLNRNFHCTRRRSTRNVEHFFLLLT